MTATNEEIAWLAGILDGEGMVCFSRKGKLNPQVKVSIRNTCPYMISKISNILSRLAANYTYSMEYKDHPKWKPSIRIQVNGLDSVKRFLSACYPYLTTKREEASLMLAYVSWRETLPRHTGNHEQALDIRAMQETAAEELQKLKSRRLDPDAFTLEPNKPLVVN
jgi:hypothetical protein